MAPGMGRALAPGGAQGRGPEGQAGARLELAPGKKGRVTLKSVPDELSFDKVRLPPPPPQIFALNLLRHLTVQRWPPAQRGGHSLSPPLLPVFRGPPGLCQFSAAVTMCCPGPPPIGRSLSPETDRRAGPPPPPPPRRASSCSSGRYKC